MRVSQNGIDLIKHFEGLRLVSYQDVAGIWTIGYGHTGPEVGPNQRISEDEAEAILRKDIRHFEDGVDRHVDIEIDQNQFDALVSLAYNIGLNAFRKSTALRLLNRGDFFGAAEAITWWNKATIGGVKREIMGLVRRRAAESALFLENVAGMIDDVIEPEDSSRIQPEENAPRRSNPINSRTTGGAIAAGAAGAAGAGSAIMGGEEGDNIEKEVIPVNDLPVEGDAEEPITDLADEPETSEPELVDPDTSSEEEEALVLDGDIPTPEGLLEDTAPEPNIDDTPVIDAEPDVPVIEDIEMDDTLTPEEEPSDAPVDEVPSDTEPETIDEPITDGSFDQPPEDVLPSLEDLTGETDAAPLSDVETDDLPPLEDEIIDDTPEPIYEDITVEDIVDVPTADNTTAEVGVPKSSMETGDVTKEDYQEGFQIVSGALVVLSALYVIYARVDDWRKFRR